MFAQIIKQHKRQNIFPASLCCDIGANSIISSGGGDFLCPSMKLSKYMFYP